MPTGSPDSVGARVSERQFAKPGVLSVADVASACAPGAGGRLEDQDFIVGWLGPGRLEAMAVVVCEGQLCAGCGCSRLTITRDQVSHADRSKDSVISAT